MGLSRRLRPGRLSLRQVCWFCTIATCLCLSCLMCVGRMKLCAMNSATKPRSAVIVTAETFLPPMRSLLVGTDPASPPPAGRAVSHRRTGHHRADGSRMETPRHSPPIQHRPPLTRWAPLGQDPTQLDIVEELASLAQGFAQALGARATTRYLARLVAAHPPVSAGSQPIQGELAGIAWTSGQAIGERRGSARCAG